MFVDTILIGTKEYIPKCILNVVGGYAFSSFPITFHNHILSFLLSDTMTQDVWITCVLKQIQVDTMIVLL